MPLNHTCTHCHHHACAWDYGPQTPFQENLSSKSQRLIKSRVNYKVRWHVLIQEGIIYCLHAFFDVANILLSIAHMFISVCSAAHLSAP